MMKEKYVPIRSEEMKMMVEYRNKTKLYKIMNPIFWGCLIFLAVAPFVLQAVLYYRHDMPFWSENLFGWYIAETGLFLIPMIFIIGLRSVPGRDLFNARLGESISLDEEAFKDEWSPRVSPDKAKYMGYKIAYKDMTRIDYDPEFKRLEIYGKRMVFKDFGAEMRTICEDDGKPFLVYGYFENMDQLKESLARRSGLTIRNLEFGSAKAHPVAAHRAAAR